MSVNIARQTPAKHRQSTCIALEILSRVYPRRITTTEQGMHKVHFNTFFHGMQ